MTDVTIPDAAVEAAARAMDANFNPDYYPILSAMFSDYAATALPAAAPYIAAQALEDLLTDAPPTGRVPHPFHSWREWIAYRALRLREPIEADHG